VLHGAGTNDADYTIASVTWNTPNTDIVVDETINSSTVQGIIGFIFTKDIFKPVVDTVRVWVAGTEKTEDTHFSVNHKTGLVTFIDPNRPTTGQEIRAWYEYDYPVRFEEDNINEILDTAFARSDLAVQLIELKNGIT